jgi:hypothetical protein
MRSRPASSERRFSVASVRLRSRPASSDERRLSTAGERSGLRETCTRTCPNLSLRCSASVRILSRPASSERQSSIAGERDRLRDGTRTCLASSMLPSALACM